MIIDDIEIALKYTIKSLKKEPFTTLNTNNKRHKFIYFTDGSVAYFMFKRQPLYKWLELYPSLRPIETQVSYVDSINIPLFYSLVERYLQKKFKEKHIIICYSNGTILKIRPEEWLIRANEYMLYRVINRLNFERSDNYTGQDEYIKETVMSCYFTEEEIII